jgi:hypothetical protein
MTLEILKIASFCQYEIVPLVIEALRRLAQLLCLLVENSPLNAISLSRIPIPKRLR